MNERTQQSIHCLITIFRLHHVGGNLLFVKKSFENNLYYATILFCISFLICCGQ
jgi:hypothetical protein